MNERWNAQIVKIGGERTQTRRALSVINQNLVGAHRYPCIVNKRELSQKFGATLIGTLHQHYLEETKKPKPAIGDFTIWEEHDTNEAQPVPMCLEQPESFSNDKEVEIEMEDVFEEALIDIDNDDAKNPLAGVEYVGDLYAYYRKMECAELLLKISALLR
uniref:Uncharacterized protein n=1 Tax=Solanum lycopersicum TaxID=4081 RepID=A0A3Q7F045_SOLLC